MTRTKILAKTTALTLATSLLAGGLLPLSQAHAHDRHRPASHGVHHHNWNKHTHRNFHRQYGHGQYGGHAYQQQHVYRQHPVQRKRSSKGDLIAAGVIGLALGAIIAGEASKNRQVQPSYQYRQPAPQHSYQPSYQYRQPAPQQYNQPNVITFEESASLEPWTPGWRQWCTNRYRSFNSQTGTFRGYDGLDHFCVPR